MVSEAVTMPSIKSDCRWFRGTVPCAPHKKFGVHCVEPDGSGCRLYERRAGRILLIKLGAIGDVIRTTPLLHAFRAHYPGTQIWWLTLTPEVVPPTVDAILPFSPQSLAILRATQFDLLVNLDKDPEACALAATTHGSVKKGFTLIDGVPAPVDMHAQHKFLTGLFDDLSRSNTKSYQEEMFEICGLTFAGETYILDNQAAGGYRWKLPHKKKVVGLNTGCGGRWTSRLWAEKNWISLARRLKKAGHVPLLLGGEQEDAKNRRIARASGALYFGHFPLRQFINLVDQCTCVVTAVTMAMHITIALRKKIVLFNNTFNPHEFDLYGLGEILKPDFNCSCYYSPVCPNNCMQYLRVDKVFDSCTRLLRP
ncbi:MAG TPA: glycosyltransferase family 9 protein [Bacteroidota bacterium]|nr:glycosyltransferase family 9 protein [Bacteroidota bacterium]